MELCHEGAGGRVRGKSPVVSSNHTKHSVNYKPKRSKVEGSNGGIKTFN